METVTSCVNHGNIDGAAIFVLFIVVVFFVDFIITIHEIVACAALSTGDEAVWTADDSTVGQRAGTLLVIAAGWAKRD